VGRSIKFLLSLKLNLFSLFNLSHEAQTGTHKHSRGD
jgi:hypothetical protein